MMFTGLSAGCIAKPFVTAVDSLMIVFTAPVSRQITGAPKNQVSLLLSSFSNLADIAARD
jgi:hypothetical protein